MNIWTGLLFLEGAVADSALARELAGEAATEAGAAPPTHDDERRAVRDATAANRWFTGAGQY